MSPNRPVGIGPLHRAEADLAAVGEQRIDGQHMIAHDAVADRAGAAGVVARHAAERGPRGGRDVDRKPQAMGLERPVQFVQHDAGLDHAAPVGGIDLDDAVEVPRGVEDQRLIDRLAALRRAAAARQHADTRVAGNCERRGHVRGVARGGDGRPASPDSARHRSNSAAGERVEPHLAVERPAETLLQSRTPRHETPCSMLPCARPAFGSIMKFIDRKRT
jgi:hypothetical protein